jgi:DNA-directed RNA polymerase
VTLKDEQLAREKAQRDQGAFAFERARQWARRDESVSVGTTFGQKLLREYTAPIAEAMDRYSGEHAGKFRKVVDRHRFHLKLSENPLEDGHEDLSVLEVVAQLVLSTLLDLHRDSKSVSATTVQVADALEEAARMSFYSEHATPYQRAVQLRGLKICTTLQFQAPEFLDTLAKMGWEPWEVGERLHFAQTAINIVVETVRHNGHPVFDAAGNLTIHGLLWRKQHDDLMTLLANRPKPMIVAPKQWMQPEQGGAPVGGGYLQEGMPPGIEPDPFIKPRFPNLRLELNPMPTVTGAVNLLDATKWRINDAVLKVVEADTERVMHETERHLSRLKFDPDAPKPERRRVGILRKALKVVTKKLDQTGLAIKEARELQGYHEVSFPHQPDFRGRMCCKPAHLHPQGSDAMRGLLLFAEGKPIATAEARRWLAVHGANCFGGEIKRKSYEAREQWVDEHAEQIKGATTDTSAGAWWRGAGDPYQFLAFCHEWTAYLQQGTGFLSSLPVVVDGTCNGLQHYAALLGDAVLARRVNLIDDDEPHDVYADVAEQVIERLKVEDGAAYSKVVRARTKRHLGLVGRATGEDKATLQAVEDAAQAETIRLSQVWLASGLVNRKLLKGPVMTASYGAGRQSMRNEMRDYVFEDVAKAAMRGDSHALAEEQISNAVDYLIWVAHTEVSHTVEAAMVAQQWLKGFVKGIVKARALSWHSPTNFPAGQAYEVTKKQEVAGKRRNGRQWKRRVWLPTDKINVKKQGTGLPPNIVHSIDAAHAQMTAVAASERGVGSLTMIHDCFGTHAADMETLATVLREQFVKLYTDHPDLLRDVVREILRPFVKTEYADVLEDPKVEAAWAASFGNSHTPPYELQRGELEVAAVLKSKFFFS